MRTLGDRVGCAFAEVQPRSGLPPAKSRFPIDWPFTTQASLWVFTRNSLLQRDVARLGGGALGTIGVLAVTAIERLSPLTANHGWIEILERRRHRGRGALSCTVRGVLMLPDLVVIFVVLAAKMLVRNKHDAGEGLHKDIEAASMQVFFDLARRFIWMGWRVWRPGGAVRAGAACAA